MESQYSLRSPAVKRLMKEAAELREPTELFFAQPLEDNLFEWHFSVRGPPDTEFESGIYHGRIILPPDYPMKPPSIVLLTPNGRFELNKKICLSISGFHPETWQPSWSIRTALLAMIGFMPTHGAGAIGSLDYPSDERKVLAKRSLDWKCPTCGVLMRDALPALTESSKSVQEEAMQLAQQISFKDERDQKSTSSSSSDLGEAHREQSGSLSAETVQSSPLASPSPVEVAPRATIAGQQNIGENSTDRGTVETIRRHHHNQQAAVNNADAGGSAELLMIVIIAIIIAALLFRRIWIMNDDDSQISRSDL